MELGVKAHWRDVDLMARIAREHDAGTLELHLTSRDVFQDRERVLEAFRPYRNAFRLVVHQPEWTVDASGARVFTDPSARDERVHARTVQALVRTTEVAAALDAGGVIVHPGAVDVPGASEAGPVERVRDTFRAVRRAGEDIPLWLENMPWFYGWQGPGSGIVGRARIGQGPGDYATLDDVVDGYCLDFCHAFLAAPADETGGGWDAVDAFLDAWGSRVRHAHVAGAVRYARDAPNPRAGEGVPPTTGDMGADAYAARLARVPGHAAVVPEIDHGFREGARGFRDALRWLRDVTTRS